jgi:hypothetical protein
MLFVASCMLEKIKNLIYLNNEKYQSSAGEAYGIFYQPTEHRRQDTTHNLQITTHNTHCRF